LAYINFQTNRRESGLEFARRTLHLIEAAKVFQLFLDQGDRGRVVSQALIESGEQSPFLERVLEHLPEKQIDVIVDEHAISVKCLGTFRVYVGGKEISQEHWVSAKARDLLAYFVTFRDERIPVERVVDAIWGERGSSRTAFHTALSRLRNALRNGEEAPRFIFVETGEYWLDSARFRIDANEFNNAILKARSSNSLSAAARWYERAVDLYKGEYLQNMYYDWIFAERRSLSQMYLSALRELVAYHASSPDPRPALHYFEKALLVDNLDEDLYCHAMRAYAALGDRINIGNLFNELKNLLERELGSEPLPRTTNLYNELLDKLRQSEKK
jgi:two-component SAPR family response regulator